VDMKIRVCEGVDRIRLAKDGVQRTALIKTVKNVRKLQPISEEEHSWG
jgi:hypothetical protein